MDRTTSPESTPAHPPAPAAGAASACRESWEASRTLLAAQPGRYLEPRARLHLAGLVAGLGALSGPAREAHLRTLEAALGTPAFQGVTALLAGAGGVDLPQALPVLEAAHERTLALLEQDLRVARTLQARRLVLAGSVALALAAGGVGATRLWAWWRAPPDLARGKPWTTSSVYAACQPEQGQCGPERTKALFYTQEQLSPWYQVDLGGPTSFSRVTVRNRSDMLLERAVPLVLEVSADAASWREVARRVEPFARWDAAFAPVTARYLRARVDRFSALHLEGVEVHP